MEETKLKAIESAVKAIEKQFGKGSIMLLGDEEIKVDVNAISTGSIGLDVAIGIGGYPRGRIIEIYGPESAGKTTLALEAVAQAQKKGGVCAYIDVEHALDLTYAKVLGIDPKLLLISQPDSGEEALEIAETLVKSSSVDLVVIDSVAALVTKRELESEMGSDHMAPLARLMAQAMKKLPAVIHKSESCVIFVNQIRENIGVIYGSPEVQPGGRALKFHASVRVEIRRIGSIKKGEEFVGLRVRTKVVKNKMAPPFRKAEFDIIFGKGISRIGEVVDMAVQKGVILKAGSWYSYNNEQIAQGRDTVVNLLEQKNNEVLYNQIYNDLIHDIVGDKNDTKN